MKKLLLIFSFLFAYLGVFAQQNAYTRGDSIFFTNKTKNAKIVIQNATKDSTGKFAKNMGKGVLEYKQITIPDISHLQDSLDKFKLFVNFHFKGLATIDSPLAINLDTIKTAKIYYLGFDPITKALRYDTVQYQAGFNSPDAVISGLSLSKFISGVDTSLAVNPGVWRIDNTIYSSSTITYFPLLPRDPILSRYAIVYADTLGTLHLEYGLFSSSPTIPDLPDSTVYVNTMLVTPLGDFFGGSSGSVNTLYKGSGTLEGPGGAVVTIPSGDVLEFQDDRTPYRVGLQIRPWDTQPAINGRAWSNDGQTGSNFYFHGDTTGSTIEYFDNLGNMNINLRIGGMMIYDSKFATGLVATPSIDTANMTANPKAYVTSEWVVGHGLGWGTFLPLNLTSNTNITLNNNRLQIFAHNGFGNSGLALDSARGFFLSIDDFLDNSVGAQIRGDTSRLYLYHQDISGNKTGFDIGPANSRAGGVEVQLAPSTIMYYTDATHESAIRALGTGIPDVKIVRDIADSVKATISAIASVSGTPSRITSTGGITPVIDISATFEALLGKVANPLSQFASTTSAQLAGVLSDESGTGAVAYTTNPVFTTPNLGTPSALVGTNITGTASGFTAGNINASSNSTLTTLSALSLPYSQLTGTPTILATSNFVTAEIPSGSINSSNTAFTLANAPTSGTVKIFRNGLRQIAGTDYTISGTAITYLYAPTTGDSLIIDYMK